MTFLVPLSKLVAGRSNPRRVKPERDAHRRLVASIRATKLLQPLVVRPVGDDFNKLRSLVAAWFDGKEAINANANLSAEGRATALRELGEKTLADLDAFTAKEHGPIYHVGARLQDLRTRARGHDPKAATDAVTELRDERIRTHLRSLDELARLNAVKTAIENGDVATFRAVLHDPLASLEPMFGEEATAELKSSWLRKHDDSLLGEKIDLMRDLHEAMEVATRETRNGLAEAAGLDATLRDRIGAEAA